MALTQEIWISDIEGNLFKDGGFASQSINHSTYVNGKTVHVPNAGSKPSVTKNRSSFPGTVSSRTDYDLNYTIAELSTDPFRIGDPEKVELSYDKRASILSASIASLSEAAADALEIDDGRTVKRQRIAAADVNRTEQIPALRTVQFGGRAVHRQRCRSPRLCHRQPEDGDA